ncbi:MAG: hypothetical protein LBL24_11330 [Bacteroidales bacterium]|jgi:hypothetical protein|nr:hypothetical protein [Bacteroidales bacterium]
MSREELEKRVKELEKQLSDQTQLIASLMQRIEHQEKELSFYRNKKTGTNSFLPPFQYPGTGGAYKNAVKKRHTRRCRLPVGIVANNSLEG